MIETQNIPDNHLLVYELIKESDNAITREKILKRLKHTGLNARDLSRIIFDLIVTYEVPIGSSSSMTRKGYYICKDNRDFEVAKHSFESRINENQKRLTALEQLHEKFINNGGKENGI